MSVAFRSAVQLAGSSTSVVPSLPSGTAAGDMAVICLMVAAAGETVTQTGGTGSWTVQYAGNDNSGTYTYFFAYRVIQAGDTAPVFGWGTSASYDCALGSFKSTTAAPLGADAWSPVVSEASASSSVTPGSATASGTDGSVILTLGRGAATLSSTTWTPSSGWANEKKSGSTSSPFRYVAIDFQAGVSGTVSPGAASSTVSAQFTTAQLLIAEFVTVADTDGTGSAADGGETVPASLSDTDGTGSAADGGEQVAAAVADADSCSGSDGGASLSVQSFALGTAMPSAAWLTRWRRPLPPRQVPAFYPVTVTDGDAVAGADGGELVSTGAFTGSAAVRPPPSWQAAYRHASRPQQPVFSPVSSMTVTASVSSPGFTGGSVLQVLVLDGATQGGGASDAEALANQPGTGLIVPAFSGSFIPWVCFNDSQIVTANAAAAGNVLDVNIPGTVAPVGACGHCTGTVTAGTPVSYGLSNGTVGDEFVLAAAEVPPLVPGVPVTLDPATVPGVSDSTALTSLTSPGFVPPPGTVLVAVYGTNNGGSDDHCAFAIQDSRGLAWTLAAVVNSGGNFLAAVWTATVPTFALSDADAAGPANDFVSAATWSGQAVVPDAAHGTDGGALVTAAVPGADAGTGTDAAVIGLADSDTGHGTESDPSTAAVAGSDAGTGTDAAATGVSGSDAGHGADAGEAVTAAVPDTEAGHGTDGGETVAQAGADASSGADGGEALVRQDFTVLRLPASPSFRARYRHTSRPVMAPSTVVVTSVAGADRGLGEDAEIDNPFPVDSETPHGADAGEVVAQADSDAGTATDITFEFEFCVAADAELTAWPSDGDASLAFDTDVGNLFPAAGSDAGHGADGGESVQKNVPVADGGAGHAALDAGELVTAAVPAADAGRGTDGGEFIPKDSDASGQAADGGESVLSGLHADADFSLAFDVESRVFGPNNAVSDGDAGHGADGGELPDVYAYQPPFRWTGGQFDVRRPGR